MKNKKVFMSQVVFSTGPSSAPAPAVNDPLRMAAKKAVRTLEKNGVLCLHMEENAPMVSFQDRHEVAYTVSSEIIEMIKKMAEERGMPLREDRTRFRYNAKVGHLELDRVHLIKETKGE